MKRVSLDAELRALDGVAADPRAARALLLAGLRSARSLVAARAARLIKDHSLDGYDADLADVFERFLREPKTDPSCHAKIAALEALDYAEALDAGPFLRAVVHVQKDPSDSAGPLRARAIYALARLAHPDFDLCVARLLSDALPPVRQAALEALAHREDRAGAGLALVKLGLGDEDPLVTLAAMTTLLALAPAWALDELRWALAQDDEERRELAAVALGQSRSAAALDVLLAALERCTGPTEREPLLRGLGLHRSERALTTLLTVIAERHESDAEIAVESLAARRFEPGLVDKVRAAAARNEHADLDAVIARAFRG